MMMRVPMYVQQVALGFLHSKFLSVVQTPKINYCFCRNTQKGVYILTHWCVFTPKRRKFRFFRRLFGVKKTQCVNIHFFWCFYRAVIYTFLVFAQHPEIWSVCLCFISDSLLKENRYKVSRGKSSRLL